MATPRDLVNVERRARCRAESDSIEPKSFGSARSDAQPWYTRRPREIQEARAPFNSGDVITRLAMFRVSRWYFVSLFSFSKFGTALSSSPFSGRRRGSQRRGKEEDDVLCVASYTRRTYGEPLAECAKEH